MEEEERYPFQPLSKRRDEAEYFYKREVGLVEKMRKDLDREREEKRQAQEEERHWMCCQKCGSNLEEIEQGGVKIDLCRECGRLFLDKGELEMIWKVREHRTFLVRLSQTVDRFFT